MLDKGGYTFWLMVLKGGNMMKVRNFKQVSGIIKV